MDAFPTLCIGLWCMKWVGKFWWPKFDDRFFQPNTHLKKNRFFATSLLSQPCGILSVFELFSSLWCSWMVNRKVSETAVWNDDFQIFWKLSLSSSSFNKLPSFLIRPRENSEIWSSLAAQEMIVGVTMWILWKVELSFFMVKFLDSNHQTGHF